MAKYDIRYKKSSRPKKRKWILISLVDLILLAFIIRYAVSLSKTSTTNTVPSTIRSAVPSTVRSQDTIVKKEKLQEPPSNVVVPISLYVNPSSSAANALKQTSNPEQVRKLTVLASTPTGMWQTANSSLETFALKVNEAKATFKSPIVVLYAIPNIGCGASGTKTVAEYRNWVAQRASLLNRTGAIVIVEPDAVAQFYCLNEQQLAIRKESLNAAISELAKTDARIYIDAGHSEWVGSNEMAQRLNTLDMKQTRGISVNVSNFQTNKDSKQYASDVLSKLNVKNLGAVVDSSRNGVGPPSNKQWCNALGRKVGTSSVMEKDGVIDGYLWIKVPGESDGTGPNCSNGIKEGSFWLEYALGLVN